MLIFRWTATCHSNCCQSSWDKVTDFAGIVQELHSKLRKFFESTPVLWLEGSCSACFSSATKHFQLGSGGSGQNSVIAREEQELGEDQRKSWCTLMCAELHCPEWFIPVSVYSCHTLEEIVLQNLTVVLSVDRLFTHDEPAYPVRPDTTPKP